MKKCLHSSLVLKLNGGWQAIGYTTAKESFQRLFQEGRGQIKALDIILNHDGSISNETQSYTGLEWLELSVRPNDNWIGLTNNRRIRVPLVTIVPHFHHLPKVKLTFNKRGLYTRDRGICSYCYQSISYDEATNDHLIPLSRGGKTTWENCTLSCQKCNNAKANKTPEEAGYLLKKQPKSPGPTPILPELRRDSPPEHKALLIHSSYELIAA